MMNLENISSVGELVASIKNILEDHFQGIVVQGEISNFIQSSTGHWYFTLADEKASLSCVLFRGDALRNPILKNIKNGDHIIIIGEISVYEKRGVFQLIAKKILPKGEGKQKIAFEKLKLKLSQEGYFDVERKKKIPLLVEKIAIITATQSAALQDFLVVYDRRSFRHNLIVIPTTVQGIHAVKSIKNSLDVANQLNDIDVIVMLRGGGSSEDLSAFNDESVIRAMIKIPKPIISAIGHQTDVTLSDLVSDLRAETPTAAAEILTQLQANLIDRLDKTGKKLFMHFTTWQHSIDSRLWKLRPENWMRLIQTSLMNKKNELDSLKGSLSPKKNFNFSSLKLELADLLQTLESQISRNLISYQHKLEMIEQKITIIHPHQIMKKGYCYILGDKKVLKNKSDWNKSTVKKREIVFVDGVEVINIGE